LQAKYDIVLNAETQRCRVRFDRLFFRGSKFYLFFSKKQI